MKTHLVFCKSVLVQKSETKYNETLEINVEDLDQHTKKKYDSEWATSIQSFIKKDNEKKSIIDAFQFNKYSNHWFYMKFLIFHRFKESFYEIKEIEKYLKLFDEIEISSSRLKQNMFLLNDKVKILKINNQKYKKNSITLTSLFMFFTIHIYKFYKSKKIYRKSKRKINFLHGHNKAINKVYINKDTEKEIDIIWGILYEKYPENYQIIEELDLIKPLIDNDLAFDRKYFLANNNESIYSEFIFIRSLFKFKSLMNLYSDHKSIQNLKKTIPLIESTISNELIKSIILNNLGTFYFNSFKNNAYNSFFKLFPKESSVTLYTENDSSGKVIVNAAKLNGLSSYAIQHGIINESNYSYNLSQYEQSVNTLPDKTFVWGQKYKDYLIQECHYTNNNVIVTGQLRTDVIKSLKDKQKASINSKQITFFSQPQPYIKDRLEETEILFKVIKEIPEINLIVKLHPRETDDIFTNLINKYKIENIVVDDRTDIYKLINESDLCITCYSTVGIEILYFDKILITLDSKKKDLALFTKNNISYTAANQKELKELILNFYNNKLEQKKDVKRYLSQTSKIDGLSSERMHLEITS